MRIGVFISFKAEEVRNRKILKHHLWLMQELNKRALLKAKEQLEVVQCMLKETHPISQLTSNFGR